MIGSVLTITNVSKPPRATRLTATVKVEGDASSFEVIRAGLAALHESQNSLFGWGIVEYPGIGPMDVVSDALVTVYADKD